MAQREKKLDCGCGRESYTVALDCTKVTCWRCIQEELEKRGTKKENIPTGESSLPSQLLHLPREERKQILAASAKKVAKHYDDEDQKLRPPTAIKPPPKKSDRNYTEDTEENS